MAILFIPSAVLGDSSGSPDARYQRSLPELEATLNQANRMAGDMTLAPNRAEAEMKELAGKVDAYYRSPEFQGRLKGETARIRSELFGAASARFYPDSTPPAAHGRLGSDERLYLFVSSSLPPGGLHDQGPLPDHQAAA